MRHTKFQGNQSSGSGEDDYLGFTMYGHSGHSNNATKINTFFPSFLGGCISHLIKICPVYFTGVFI